MTDSKERRTNRRDLFTATVEYTLPADADTKGKGCTVGLAMSNNLSRKGISLYLSHKVSAGSCITLFSRKIADSLMSGRVRWCNRVSENFYRVGISFN